VEQLLAFLGVAVLVIVTPGPDTAVTIRSTLLGGRRAGVHTAFGVVSGQACWTIAASAGVTALLIASEPAFLAVKFAGAGYLVFLGLQSLSIALGRGRLGSAAVVVREPRGLAPRTAYRQGFVSDLGNPKMAAFFTSLLPQFAGGGTPSFWLMLGLGLLFCALTFAWLAAYAFAVAKVGDALRRPRIRAAVEGVTGVVLIALGVRVATEHR
jgi:threonine/homoserine/homoserine lactone efflux protein